MNMRGNEPGLGTILYWLATLIAAVIAIFVIADFFFSFAQGHPIIRIVALVVAVFVWLLGRAFRSLSP